MKFLFLSSFFYFLLLLGSNTKQARRSTMHTALIGKCCSIRHDNLPGKVLENNNGGDDVISMYSRWWFFCPSRTQDANISCGSGWLRVWGSVLALSDHQKALIVQTSHTSPAAAQGDVCGAPTTDRYTSTGQRSLHTRTRERHHACLLKRAAHGN